MATHLLGPGPGASLGASLLLHGSHLVLGRCLLLPDASVPTVVCDAGARGQDAGTMLNCSCSCSKALRARNRWCCRLLLLCLFRTTAMVFRLLRDGHCTSGASRGTIPASSQLGARAALDAIFQWGRVLEREHIGRRAGRRMPGHPASPSCCNSAAQAPD